MATPNPNVDPYGYLHIVPNPDGTITRKSSVFPVVSPCDDPLHVQATVLTKDIPINPCTNTWARIFLPHQHLLPSSPTTTKLPLLVHFHGGGFILSSADFSINHDFCSNMALSLSALVVSINYRLAPEHRLPAAYDDCLEALYWIKTADQVWLREYACLSDCYLIGESAGGNIAYHVGLRAAAEADNLSPLKIRGLVLLHPFFGGVKRSESEKRLVNDAVIPQVVADIMWDLALPKGVDRDHEYCNPTVGGGSKLMERMKWVGYKVLVAGGDGDPLVDREIELAAMLKEKGVRVESRIGEGDPHCIELFDPSKANSLFAVIKNFIHSA